MVISVDLIILANKLETICKNFYQRKDIAHDNRARFSKLQHKFRAAHSILQELQSRTWDIIRETKLKYFQAIFEQMLAELDSFQHPIQMAKASSRVKQIKELLQQLEAEEKEFEEFLISIALPAYDKQNENLNASALYKPISNVPPNPPYLTLDYNSKDTAEGQLKAAVLEQVGKGIIGVIASGLGGTGKTCAVRGLARDNNIEKMFPGGALYIQLGNNSNIVTVVNGVASIVERTGNKLLARQLRGLKTLEEVVDTACEWFYDAKCMLLVDDIWHLNGIGYDSLSTLKSMLSDECCLVYTTRDQRFKDFSDKIINFGSRDSILAGGMLRTHGGFGENDVLLSEENANAFQKMLEKCAGLPLALGIAGASVRKISVRKSMDRRESAWADYTVILSQKQYLLTSGWTPGYGELKKIVDVSLIILREDYREKFRALCVIRKQQTVPLRMLQRLWNLEGLDETELIVNTLSDVSLIQCVDVDDVFYIQLHDLILEIAVEKAQSQIQKYCCSLIRNYATECGSIQKAETGKRKSEHMREGGRRSGRRKTDSGPVNRVGTRDGNDDSENTVGEDITTFNLCVEWWNVADDGYIHDNLCYLLREADCRKGLKWLLSKPQWIVKRLQEGGIYRLEQDLGIHQGRQDSGRHRDTVYEEEAMHRKHLDMIARAARMSMMHVELNPREAWFQLYGRLQWYALYCEKTQQFVEEIERCAPRPWVRSSLGFLHQAGSSGGESIWSCGVVLDLHQSDEDIMFLWSRRGGVNEVGVTRYNMKTRLRQEVVRVKSRDGSSKATNLSVARCGAVSRDERMVAFGNWNGEVKYYHVTKGIFVKTLGKHTGGVRCVAFITGTRRSVSGSYDKTVRIWDIDSGAAVGQPLRGHTDSVRCVAVTTDGRRMVSGSADKTIRIWDIDSGAAVGQPLQGHTDQVTCVAVTTDGRRIVSGSEDRTVRIWDVDSGATVGQPLRGHKIPIRCVAVTTDGCHIVSGSADRTIRIWNMNSGAAVGQPLQGHTATVECVAVTTDGRHVVSGSLDKTVRIWDVDSSAAVGQALQGHCYCLRLSHIYVSRIVYSSYSDTATAAWRKPARLVQFAPVQ